MLAPVMVATVHPASVLRDEDNVTRRREIEQPIADLPRCLARPCKTCVDRPQPRLSRRRSPKMPRLVPTDTARGRTCQQLRRKRPESRTPAETSGRLLTSCFLLPSVSQ